MTGRCAGCGLTDRDSGLVREHVRYCDRYRELYVNYPERALEPEAEFSRWRDTERAAQRESSRQKSVNEAERRRSEQSARWETPPDLLGEEE